MASTLVFVGEVWLWIGAAVSVIFLTIGIDRIDEDAQGTYLFRPLLIPGILLIWPMVLWRWAEIERKGEVTLARYRPVRKSYPVAAILMSGLICLFLMSGWSARQTWPADVPAVQLAEPE